MSAGLDTSTSVHQRRAMPDDLAIPLHAVPPELEFSAWVGVLVRDHRESLVHTAAREGLLAQEALDAVQDAFASFVSRAEWRALPRHGDDAPRLLTTLVKNHARNLRRKSARKDLGMDSLTRNEEVDQAWCQLDELMAEAQEHLKLTGCIATLKEVQRTVVTLRFFEGVSGLEVARKMGMTPGNVAVTLHRARQGLRTCLEASRHAFGLDAP